MTSNVQNMVTGDTSITITKTNISPQQLDILFGAIRKMAGKAGSNWGKSLELNEELLWHDATKDLRRLKYVIQDILSGNERIDKFSFTFEVNEPEFQEFLSSNFATEAAAASKKAIEILDPSDQKSQFDFTAMMFVNFKNQVNGIYQLSLSSLLEPKVSLSVDN